MICNSPWVCQPKPHMSHFPEWSASGSADVNRTCPTFLAGWGTASMSSRLVKSGVPYMMWHWWSSERYNMAPCHACSQLYMSIYVSFVEQMLVNWQSMGSGADGLKDCWRIGVLFTSVLHIQWRIQGGELGGLTPPPLLKGCPGKLWHSIWLMRHKGCSRNYPRGCRKHFFCPAGGGCFVDNASKGWGVTCPGGQGTFDP